MRSESRLLQWLSLHGYSRLFRTREISFLVVSVSDRSVLYKSVISDIRLVWVGVYVVVSVHPSDLKVRVLSLRGVVAMSAVLSLDPKIINRELLIILIYLLVLVVS